MNSGANNRKNAARINRQERKLNAGFMHERFPEVSDIVINMVYNQRGLQKSLPRVVNYFPDSYAMFRINCLNKECLDGGFDFTILITGMIEKRKKIAKGSINCEGESPSANHATIVYDIAIQYV